MDGSKSKSREQEYYSGSDRVSTASSVTPAPLRINKSNMPQYPHDQMARNDLIDSPEPSGRAQENGFQAVRAQKSQQPTSPPRHRQEPPLPRMQRANTQPLDQLPYLDRIAAERDEVLRLQQQHARLSQQDQDPDDLSLASEQSPVENSPSGSTPVSLRPVRHVSVKDSDNYPAPPAFRAREGRPQRLQRAQTQPIPEDSASSDSPDSATPSYTSYHQQYWPPQSSSTLDRTLSNSSTITVTARRGSPPPPETPISAFPSSTGDRFSRVFGGSNVSPSPSISGRKPHHLSINPGAIPIALDIGQHPAPSSRASSRASQIFGSQFHDDDRTPVATNPPARPWTPTESPGSYNHGPPTVWQGASRQGPSPLAEETPVQPHVDLNGQPQFIPAPDQNLENGATPIRQSQAAQALEQEFQRLNVGDEPPPSYASLAPSNNPANNAAMTSGGYPAEKSDPAFQQQLQQQQPPQGESSRQLQDPNQLQPAQQQHPNGYGPGQEQQYHDQVKLQQQLQLQQQQLQQQYHEQQQQQQQQQQQMQLPPGQMPQPGQMPMSPGQMSMSPGQQQMQQPLPFDIYRQQGMQHPDQKQPENITTQYVTVSGGDAKSQIDAGLASPPPLPDGWMSHLDASSGQYYYIHIPTQRTQWEFPAPETGLSLMSGQMSPGFAPMSPGIMSPGMFSEAVLSPAASAYGMQMTLPPMPGQTMPQPVTVVNIPGISGYKAAPSNGVYFGPYLRYTNMDLDHGIWLGSILLVTSMDPPSIHLHQTLDLSPNPRQLEGHPIFAHKNWTFYRYDIDIQMGDMPAKWTYAVTSQVGCTRYEFLVAGRTERNWRFISHSNNDYGMHVHPNERTKLGGTGFLWKDVMQKHVEVGGFHCQIGCGGQIFADRMWREIPLLKEWIETKGKENRKNSAWSPKHEEDVQHAYFHYYSSHLDQPHLREAWAQIPHICQLDDHDIFDGFGSYPEYMQFSNMFKNIGRIALDWYLLFQHHTTLNILKAVPDERDLFSITGTGWHFIKYLGPGVALVGPDTRSERNPHQVMAGPTYQGLFPRIATLPASVQHVLVILTVPIVYPRMDMAESMVNTMQQSKKAVNGLFNMTGKIAGGVAGVVGAKTIVGEGFNQVKKAVGKSGLLSGKVSVFGEVDLLDDLRDFWTHESKDLERTYLIRTLQGIAHARGFRFTFLSGDVNCCGVGLVHDPSKPADHKTMYQIISSGIVNAPPTNMVMRMLHNNKQLYIPQNGMRSTNAPSDTKEDMIEMFATDVNGQPREHRKLMARRNYAIFAAYETPVVDYTQQMNEKYAPPLNLAIDFIVQGDASFATTSKYGPVVISRCEFGY